MPNNQYLPLPQESTNPKSDETSDLSISLIRKKLDSLFDDNPIHETHKDVGAQTTTGRSKHQQFIETLLNSGKNMVEIQTAWHNCYQGLNDKEKRQVWQEYYENATIESKLLKPKTVQAVKKPLSKTRSNSIKARQTKFRPPQQVIGSLPASDQDKDSVLSVAKIKRQIINNVTAQGKLSKKHHLQSLLFGLGVGLIVITIFMFGFFNERIIAPLISPSKTITDTPIIVDPTASDMVGPEAKIIIPKINVEIPVVYDVTSIKEKEVNTALERGVVHYPITPTPGQLGNVVIVGHSSNNLFNQGRYKFAFVLLGRLQEGDTFMLNYNGQRYVYKVYQKKIVSPKEVSVLGPADRPSTATLITCDPPGTALNRLVVVGEQISPEPSKNIAIADTNPAHLKPVTVPGNAESLFQRLFGWIWR